MEVNLGHLMNSLIIYNSVIILSKYQKICSGVALASPCVGTLLTMPKTKKNTPYAYNGVLIVSGRCDVNVKKKYRDLLT